MQYIGARYVPYFYENPNGTNEWLEGVSYEPLTVVSYGGNSFTSKKLVPSNIGSPNLNSEYWVNTGNYNQQIANVQETANNALEDATEALEVANSVKDKLNKRAHIHYRVFVDNLNGDDNNDGLSYATAWKTFDPVVELMNIESEIRVYICHSGVYEIKNIDLIANANVHVDYYTSIDGEATLVFVPSADTTFAIYGGHWNFRGNATYKLEIDCKTLQGIRTNIYFDQAFVAFTYCRLLIDRPQFNACTVWLANSELNRIQIRSGIFDMTSSNKINNIVPNTVALEFILCSIRIIGGIVWENLTADSTSGSAITLTKTNAFIGSAINIPNAENTRYFNAIDIKQGSILEISKARFDGAIARSVNSSYVPPADQANIIVHSTTILGA